MGIREHRKRRASGDSRAVRIPLHEIHLSASNRKALQRDEGQIEKLRRLLEKGKQLLPVKLLARPDGGYDIDDGRHRFLAHERAGLNFIEAFVLGGF